MRPLRRRAGPSLEAYLADLEAGRPADPERLLAEHPAIAETTAGLPEVMNLADRMVDGSDSGPAHRRRPRLIPR